MLSIRIRTIEFRDLTSFRFDKGILGENVSSEGRAFGAMGAAQKNENGQPGLVGLDRDARSCVLGGPGRVNRPLGDPNKPPLSSEAVACGRGSRLSEYVDRQGGKIGGGGGGGPYHAPRAPPKRGGRCEEGAVCGERDVGRRET